MWISSTSGQVVKGSIKQLFKPLAKNKVVLGSTYSSLASFRVNCWMKLATMKACSSWTSLSVDGDGEVVEARTWYRC